MRATDRAGRHRETKLRIIALLREYRQASRFGPREFEAELGKGRRWLDRRADYAFDVADLFEVLEVLDLDPVDFVREVYDDDGAASDGEPDPNSENATKLWAER